MVYRSALILISVLGILLSFPPFNLFPLAFISLIPLIYVFQTSNHPFKIGLIWGSSLYLGFNTWILCLNAFGPTAGVISLWIGSSIVFGIYVGGIGFFSKKYPQTPLSFACLWVVFEYLKSIGPFGNPGTILGYSQVYHMPFVQLSKIGGVFLLSFIIVFINVLIYKSLIEKKEKKYILYTLLLLLSCEATGIVLTQYYKEENAAKLTIGIIQPNHSQIEKLNGKSEEKFRNDYLSLTENFLKKQNVQLIVWAETITPEYNTNKVIFMHKLKSLCETYHTRILFGSPMYSVEENKLYNSAILITKNQLQEYQKVKLMPFGEYWPFKEVFQFFNLENILPSLEFSPGKKHLPLKIDNTKIGASICLESTYPWVSKQLIAEGSDYLVTLVNNAWFFNSSAAEKHLQMSTLRAIELNKYLIQGSSTGISAIISNNGEKIGAIPLDQKGSIKGQIKLTQKKSPYTYVGESIVFLSMIYLGILFYSRIKKKPQQ